MPCLQPNQQRQGTEGTYKEDNIDLFKAKKTMYNKRVVSTTQERPQDFG